MWSAPVSGEVYRVKKALLDYNLAAINDVDALEAFGVSDTATVKVVDEL